MNMMMEFKSSDINTGVAISMHCLESELKTELQRTRGTATRYEQVVRRSELGQRLSNDIREVRAKVQNPDELLPAETNTI